MWSVFGVLTLHFVTMAAAFGLMAYSCQNRREPGGPAFCALMGATFTWSLFSVFLLIADDLDTMIVLARLRQAFIVFSGPLVVLILTHVSPETDLYEKRGWQSLFFVLPVLSFLALVVPSFHQFGIHEFARVEFEGFSTVTYQRGLLMQVQRVFAYGCTLYAASIAFRLWLRGDAKQKRRAIWLAGGSIAPMLGHLAGTVSGWPVSGYGSSAVLTLIMAVCLSVALFRYQIMDWAHLTKSQVFERLSDPVLKLDDRTRLRVFNSAAARVLDLENEHLGKTWAKLGDIPMDLREKVGAEIHRMAEHRIAQSDLEWITSAGDSRIWRIHLEAGGETSAATAGYLIRFHDISERTQLEAMVRARTAELSSANLQLEELVGFKNRLLALVAHDLSGNIGTMVLVSSALQNKIESQVDEPSRKMLRLMVRSSVTVQEFFSNLIHWIAKLDSRLEPHLSICDLRGLVEKSVEQLTPMLIVQRQRVLMKAKDPVMVTADPDMITAVIRNLLSNAIAASAIGTEIEVGIEDLPQQVRLWVADQGTGMSDERLQQVLQGHQPPAKTAETGGFGIGLGICRDFVRFHGGRLEGESQLGQGTRISVMLPKNPGAPQVQGCR